MNDSPEKLDPRNIDIDEFLIRWFKDAPSTFGTTHPDSLPQDDPRVQQLFVPYHSWIRGLTSKAEKIGTPEAHLEMSLKVTPFLVEVGFTDPDYVNEVVYDWLSQDLDQAQSLGLTELADKFRTKIDNLLEITQP